jgi:hypothetical protein
VRRSDAVAKRALAFGAPHESVDVVGTGVVFDEAGQKISIFGIVDAQCLGVTAVKIALLQFLDVG